MKVTPFDLGTYVTLLISSLWSMVHSIVGGLFPLVMAMAWLVITAVNVYYGHRQRKDELEREFAMLRNSLRN